MENVIFVLGGVIIFAVMVMVIGIIFSKLYKKSSKEVAFVRTGGTGARVVKDGGALVFPMFHNVTYVNMSTLRLDVKRKDKEALITFDRMRVDVSVEFYVRVKQDVEAINLAAQTLGNKTTNPDLLKSLIEGKLVDVLRSVASSMTMNDLHEKRSIFVQNVQNGVSKDLQQNGLELESVSLTSFDQTLKQFFNPENAFDAQGLTLLTSEIESRRKIRNQIEKDNQLEIEKKNLENQKEALMVNQQLSEVQLSTQREISFQTDNQKSITEKYGYEQRQEAEKARIAMEGATEQLEMNRKRQLDIARISIEKELEQLNISRQREILEANIQKEKSVALTIQEKEIALAQKSEERAAAESKAQKARAELVTETERVKTLEAVATAERDMQVQIINAKSIAEKDSAKIVVAAVAEQEATKARSDSIIISARADATAVESRAQANANAMIMTAKAQSEADIVAADGIVVRMKAEAQGREDLILAQNKQSIEVIEAENRKLLISTLPQIIAESSKHLSQIGNISIVDVSGFGGVGGSDNNGVLNSDNGKSLPDQVVDASLRHRTYSSLVDHLMGKAGLEGGKNIESSINNMLGLSKKEDVN